MSLFSAAVLLFLVMDPLGNVPVFLGVLKDVHESRQRRIILRELLIAFGVLCLFLFMGRHILDALGISEPSLSIAGGVILFLIALNMIFPRRQSAFAPASRNQEPFIVPLAIPLIAGPSAMATVLLLASRNPSRMADWFLALAAAWSASAVILFFSSFLRRVLGRRGLVAVERLMGMILTTVAVQMLMTGIEQFLES
jgi:multiple antibiotic resistance protein